MTQNINGVDQDNDDIDMRCSRIGVYCRYFDSCREKILPETTGSCRAQKDAQAHALCAHMQELCTYEPVNEPTSEKNKFLVRVRDRIVGATSQEAFKQAVVTTVRDALDTINGLEKRLDAKSPSSDAKRPEPYKCNVYDCGSNVDGWCQWKVEHGTLPIRCDSNDPTQHVGLYNDMMDMVKPCDPRTDYDHSHAQCGTDCSSNKICRALKRYREPDLATRLEWLDAEDDALREGLAHEGPSLVHTLQDMGGFGSTSLRELSKAIGYSATMLSRCMNGKERFTAKLYLALHALYQKRTGILRLTARASDLAPKAETVENKTDGNTTSV